MPSSRRPGDPGLDNSFAQISAIFVCAFAALAIVLAMAEHLGARSDLVAAGLVGLTLTVYLLIGLLARTNRLGKFLVAGRRTSAPGAGMAAAAQVVAVAGLASMFGHLYGMGFDGLALIVGLMGGLALSGLLVVPQFRKLGVATVPEFFAVRFGGFAGFLASLVVGVCCAALLVAALSIVGTLGVRMGLGYEAAVIAGAGLIGLSVIAGGLKGLTWIQSAQYVVLLGALVVPAALLSWRLTGLPLPHLALGPAVGELATLEIAMIEKGVASASTLKPHLSAFFQADRATFVLTVACVMAAVASMPPLLMRLATPATVREARLGVAWAGFFSLLLVTLVPASAALVKLQVYRLIERGTPVAEPPPWLEELSRRGDARIHGVSLRMLEDVSGAVRSGAGDARAAAEAMVAAGSPSAQPFLELRDSVRTAVYEAARSAPAGQPDALAQAFRASVLPVAAKAAGNKSGLMTEQGLRIEPASLAIAIPALAEAPPILSALMLAGALAGALALAGGLAFVLATTLGHDLYARHLDVAAPAQRRLAVLRLMLLAGLGGAAYVALRPPVDPAHLAAWAAALLPSALLPSLLLGAWWSRAGQSGACLAMLAGSAVALYYMLGIHYFPMEFHEMWQAVAVNGESAVRRLTALQVAWSAAEGDAKGVAWRALTAHAAGTPTEIGIANWLGLPGALAAAFAVPVGTLILVLASLLGRPSSEAARLVEGMRSPRGPELVLDPALSVPR